MATITFKLTLDPHCTATPKAHGDLALTGDVTAAFRIDTAEYVRQKQYVDQLSGKELALLQIAIAAQANNATNAQTLSALTSAQGRTITL